MLVVRREEPLGSAPRANRPAPGILWIHGGGYALGMPRMAYMSPAIHLVTQAGAVLVSPAYALSPRAPYPAALEDCVATLSWMRDHATELGIRPDQLVVGGESAGGGLAVATCLWARDHGTANVAFQMPIYPMLDCEDTPSSAHNRAPVWNTRRNHLGWCLYLRGLDRNMPVPPYASPARAYMPPADPSGLAGMPPCYTYVGDAEPFLDETLAYVRALRAAGVPAVCDIYPGWYHAYDMMHPENPHSRQAAARLVAAFRAARNGCFVSRG